MDKLSNVTEYLTTPILELDLSEQDDGRYKFPTEYDDGQRHLQLWLPAVLIIVATLIGYVGNGFIIAATIVNSKLHGSCNILLVLTVLADSIHMTSHWYYLYTVIISADNFVPYSDCLKVNIIPQFFLPVGVTLTLFVGLDRLYAVTFPVMYNTTSKGLYIACCALVSLSCASYFTAISLNDMLENEGERRVLCIIVQSMGGRAYSDFFHFSFAITCADLVVYTAVWIKLRSNTSLRASNTDFKVFKSLFVIVFLVAVGMFVNASMMSLVVPHLVNDDYNCVVSAYLGVLVNVAASLSVLPLYLYSQEYRRTIDKFLKISPISRYQVSPLSERQKRVHRRQRSYFRTMQLFILTLLSVISAVCSSGIQSLYTDKDHVLELDITNFNSSIYHQPRAFFVEFYASWCGHCIHYKPVWVQFATQVRHWSRTLQVSVVNCADEKNSALCREHAIAAFPTVKYFKINSANKDDGQAYEGDKYNLPEMTRSVVSHLKADHDTVHPANWPKLELASESATLDSLWAEAGTEAGLLALVIDNEPYGDGFATKVNYHHNEQVHVAVLSGSHVLAKQFGGLAIPSVQIFKRSQPTSPIFSSNEAFTFAQISTEIDRILEESGAQQKPPALGAQAAHPTLIPNVDWKQFEVQYLDLASSLHYMLTQEIPRREVIEKEHLKALKDFVHVMRKYVPLSAPIRRFLLRLDEFSQPITTKLTATEWLAKIKQLQDELGNPIPSKTDYKACRGSKPFLRGYTCGLWTLFHTITVEAYKQNKHDVNFKPGYDVLEPIHQFIYNYLSCVECAKNFDKMAKGENGVLDTKNPEDVVLWLWNAHNRANKRLAGDASEDPMFKKQQFPNNAICLACHRPDGSFDEAEVLKFLVQYFSDIKVDGVRPEPGYKVSEYNNGKLEKVANKHLNPKFAGMAGKVDRLEETERRLNSELNELPQGTAADRSTFYLIWFAIVALMVFAYVKYRQNRSKFWKTFYYHDYKL